MFKLLYKVSEITVIYITMNGRYKLSTCIISWYYRFHTVEEIRWALYQLNVYVKFIIPMYLQRHHLHTTVFFFPGFKVCNNNTSANSE